jgi:WD40 repeat protein
MRVWIDHPQPSDLWMRLIAPSGRAATIPVRGQAAAGGEPFEFDVGASALAELAGEPVRGTWTLEVEDRFSGSAGLLTGWELRLSNNVEVTADQPGNPILIPDPRPTSQVRVVLSPDGRRAAAVSANPESRGFLQIWDVSAGVLSARVPVEAGDRTIAFDAEGRFLVTAGSGTNPAVRVWRADSGQPLMTLESSAGFVLAPALSVSGSVLAIPELPRGNSGLRIRRADLAAARELPPVIVGGELLALAVGPQGRYLGTLDRENVVRVWDSETGQLIAQLAHDRAVTRMLFDRSGRWLATVGRDGMARIWALSNAIPEEQKDSFVRPLVVMEVQDPDALSFSADGEMLLVQPRQRSYEILALPAGTPVMPMLRHSGEMTGVAGPSATDGTFSTAFDATGTRVVTGRGGSSARVWNIPAEAPAQAGTGFANGDARVLAINPAGYQLVRGDHRGGISFLDRGQPWSPAVAEDQAAGHAGAITVLEFSDDGSHLLSVGADGSVLLWDAATRSLAGQRFHHGSGEVSSAAIGPDNRLIVTGGELGARLWDGISGEPGPVLGPGREIIDVAISADGARIATLSRDAVEFWRANDGELQWSAALPARPLGLALNGSPQRLAVALEDGRVLVWGAALQEAPVQMALQGRVMAMRFTPSGRRLLLQTGEWMHLLAVDGDRRAVASRLLNALVPAGAWRAESPDGDRITMVIRYGADELRLATIDLLKPDVAAAPEALAGQEDLWMQRLKLRFDTSGVVVPDLRSTRQPAPAGMIPSVAPVPPGTPATDQP